MARGSGRTVSIKAGRRALTRSYPVIPSKSEASEENRSRACLTRVLREFASEPVECESGERGRDIYREVIQWPVARDSELSCSELGRQNSAENLSDGRSQAYEDSHV